MTAGRQARRAPLVSFGGLSYGAACGPIAGFSPSYRAWSRPSRTTLNTCTHSAESCTWRSTEPAALPRPGTSAMPVWPAAGSAAARRLPLLRRRRSGAVSDPGTAARGHGEPPTGARGQPRRPATGLRLRVGDQQASAVCASRMTRSQTVVDSLTTTARVPAHLALVASARQLRWRRTDQADLDPARRGCRGRLT
jgi:hypothetical protein